MLKLWLARHGEAADPETAQSDFLRPLTENGRRQVSELTRWMIQREQPPETVAAALGDDSIVVRAESALAPGIDLDELLRKVSSTVAERILCVGHQPDMSRCLAGMIGGGEIHYSPGTMAGIDFPGPIVRHGGRLRWIVCPTWFGG